MQRPAKHVKRSMTIGGRTTSISLASPLDKSKGDSCPPPHDMAASTLVFQIDTEPGGHYNNLSSVIRVYVLRYYWFSVAISPSWPASKPDANSKYARE